ncbi:hypothetical protein SADUNF_Sadunf04G0074200 [Salix dunnii]|uniref:Uncharacterized protein n=1 Tax=Salix dunnii TaxID=1413687 RepID=A0A835N0L9_9ROSI|nr:hypothetical protein SADUNF_Sadunf04G0074200 [Salix dunnii]
MPPVVQPPLKPPVLSHPPLTTGYAFSPLSYNHDSKATSIVDFIPPRYISFSYVLALAIREEEVFVWEKEPKSLLEMVPSFSRGPAIAAAFKTLSPVASLSSDTSFPPQYGFVPNNLACRERYVTRQISLITSPALKSLA